MSGDRAQDDLMWLLADEGDPAAIAAFLKRHPEQRLELLTRVNLVRGLRGGRPAGRGPTRFTLPETVSPRGHSMRFPWWAVAGSLAIFGVAFGVTHFMGISRSKPVAVAQLERAAEVEHAPLAAEVNPPSDPPPPELAPRAPVATTPLETPVSIQAQDTPLLQVLNSIAAQAGLELEVAPGLANVRVTYAATSVPALAQLQSLGAQHGFSVFDQGPTRVLLIPARDPQEPSQPAPGLAEAAPPEERISLPGVAPETP